MLCMQISRWAHCQRQVAFFSQNLRSLVLFPVHGKANTEVIIILKAIKYTEANSLQKP